MLLTFLLLPILTGCPGDPDTARDPEPVPAAPLADVSSAIRGAVVDSRDEGIEGVRVHLRLPIGAGMAGLDGLTTTTDALGRFAFDVEGCLDPKMDGPVELSFEKAGWVRSHHRLDSRHPGRGRKVLLILEPAGAVSGLVADGNGAPMAEALVYAIGTEVPGVREIVEVIHTTTLPDGTFRLEGLPVGKLDIGVKAEGFLTGLVQDVAVAAGETARLADLALIRGKTIAGRVVLSDGKGPVTKALVRVFRDPALKEYRLFGRRTIASGGGSVRVDDEGRFRVTGLADGTWEVSAVTLGLAPVTPGASGVEAGTEDLELVFDRAAKVLIRVRDFETGKAIPRFTIVIVNLSGPKAADGRPVLSQEASIHSPKGEYGFPAREEEMYGVEIVAEGYEQDRRTVGPLKGLRTNVLTVPLKRRD
ncbi:MAG: carboxypeptidase-like regulatory domain-containing protein [Planctomycetota bacterium]